MSILSANGFVQNFKPEKPEQLVKFGKVDPNYVNGEALIIYDSDIGNGKLTKVKWSDHITPTANKTVLILKGVVVAQYDRSPNT